MTFEPNRGQLNLSRWLSENAAPLIGIGCVVAVLFIAVVILLAVMVTR
jgi:hypothetical protein